MENKLNMEGIKIYKRKIKKVEKEIEKLENQKQELENQKQELKNQMKGYILYTEKKCYWKTYLSELPIHICSGHSTIEEARQELNLYLIAEKRNAEAYKQGSKVDKIEITYVIYYNGEILEENTETY